MQKVWKLQLGRVYDIAFMDAIDRIETADEYQQLFPEP